MTLVYGTGHNLPEKRLTNEMLTHMVDTSEEWIVTRTGIRERRIAEHETPLDLASGAARQALASAGVRADELGLIVCATISADPVTPSLAAAVMAEIGASCPSFDVNAACSGFIYALKTAQCVCPNRPALVIGCEILSRLTDWQDRRTCVLFGDGAGAMVIGPGEADERGIRDIRLMNYPDMMGSLVVDGINHPSEDGARSKVMMNGQEVYKFATRVLASEIRALLDSQGMVPEDIDWFVPHQANLRIIQWAAGELKVPKERFFVNIDRLGNTSCASVIIALDELARSGSLHKGQHVVLSAFGGGLTSAAALIQW